MSTDQRENRPPPTNKGGRREKWPTEPQILVHIDWLSYTVPYDRPNPAKIARKAMLPVPDFRLKSHHGEGLGSYNTVLETACGALVAWHCEHPEFKVFASMSGSVLTGLIERGIFGRMLIEHALNRRAKFSRIDIAIDCLNMGAKVGDIKREFEAGEAITRAQRGHDTRGIRHDKPDHAGQTLYVGSTQSERWLRVYDKAAEQEVDHDWIRIELVSKKALAHLLAEAIGREGVPNAGRQAVRQFFRCPPSGLVAACFGWAFGGDSAEGTGNRSTALAVREGFTRTGQRANGRGDPWGEPTIASRGKPSYQVP